MKRIVLLSDTHSHLGDDVLEYCKQADEIWHAGDLGNLQVLDELSNIADLKAVYGNIDGGELRHAIKEYLVFTCEGVKVVLIHIGGYPGRYTPKAYQLILEHNPDVFISGHSHILKVIRDKRNKLIHMNPGACGIQGFHKFRTIIKFELANSRVQNLQVIDLGPRGLIAT